MQSTPTPCPLCKGQKVIPSNQGGLQVCPLCDGTGKAYDPGLQYTYRMAPVTLVGNAATVQIVTIVNWDFRWQELTGESTGAFTFLITDLGTSRQFSNVAVHSAEMLGNGTAPFPLLVPYIFSKKSAIQINITDVSGVGNTIGLAFIGANLGESAQP